MRRVGKILGLSLIVLAGVAVFGVVAGAVISPLLGTKSASRSKPDRKELMDGQPFSTEAPKDLSAALAFFSNQTDVQKDEVKNRYRGKLVQWRLPAWQVSRRGDVFTIQTSSSGPIPVFCRVTASSKEDQERMKRINAGDYVTCKGIIAGYTMGNVNLSPARLID